MWKWIVLIVIIIVCIIGYNYVFQDHRDIKNETAEFVLTAEKMQSEFNSTPSTVESKYLNKTIEIVGLITELDSSSITIDSKVFCQLKNMSVDTLKLGDKLMVKGRYIGFDDLLEEFKLDQCIIIN